MHGFIQKPRMVRQLHLFIIPVFQNCSSFSPVPVRGSKEGEGRRASNTFIAALVASAPVPLGRLSWRFLAAREAGKWGLRLGGCVPTEDTDYCEESLVRRTREGGLTVYRYCQCR